jgi:ADP-ribose 1''-phosphate phosphatase
MSLFDAPKESIIVHACNSQGVWGSGIAKPFKENYPVSFEFYNDFCQKWNDRRGTACGMAVTSHNYGNLKDSVDLIKINTTLALTDLCKKIYLAHPKEDNPSIEVYSNKFNSGLFGVPWEDSGLILNTVLKDFKRINWIVCDPDLKD